MKKILSAALALIMIFSLCTAAHASLVGDVNKDDTVNSLDALDVLLFTVGSKPMINRQRADVNRDGTINAEDALDILYITIGSYEGELETEFDKDEDVETLVTSYKADTLDPIFRSEKYTLATTVVSQGTSVPSTIMINGNDMSVDMAVDIIGIKTSCRLLVLDGKCYLVIPDLKAYSPSEVVPPESITGKEKAEYVKSEYYELNGKTYIIETYKSADGTLMQYYFLDGVWKTLVKTAPDGTVTTNRIDKFEAGVNESNFDLKSYRQINLDSYLK